MFLEKQVRPKLIKTRWLGIEDEKKSIGRGAKGSAAARDSRNLLNSLPALRELKALGYRGSFVKRMKEARLEEKG